MTKQTTEPGRVWSIVLAAGEGNRVNPFVSRWLGRSLPKEYCAFVGARSMFQHALDRAVRITPPERVIAAVAREHRHEAFSQLDRRTIGALLLQSVQQGTAASVFLPLTYVRDRNRDATVVVVPSDHFVYPEERFLALVRRAVSVVDTIPARVVLLGAAPDRLELDYGWIRPGDRLPNTPNDDVRAVRSVVEKPTASEADALLQAGGFWNTRAFVAKVSTLWEIGWQCVPQIMPLFERLEKSIGCPNEALELETIYRKVPAADFSDMLGQVPEQLALLELTGVLWSEWNTPARIAETLRRIDRQPAFPLAFLDRPFIPLTRTATEHQRPLSGHSVGGDLPHFREQALDKIRSQGIPLPGVELRNAAASLGQHSSAGPDLEVSL